jgi:hypothetical protein
MPLSVSAVPQLDIQYLMAVNAVWDSWRASNPEGHWKDGPKVGKCYIPNLPHNIPNPIMNALIEVTDWYGPTGILDFKGPVKSSSNLGCFPSPVPPGPSPVKKSDIVGPYSSPKDQPSYWSCQSCMEINPISSDTCLGCYRTNDQYMRRVSISYPNSFQNRKSESVATPIVKPTPARKSEGYSDPNSTQAAVYIVESHTVIPSKFSTQDLLSNMREIESFVRGKNPSSAECLYATKLVAYILEQFLLETDSVALVVDAKPTSGDTLNFVRKTHPKTGKSSRVHTYFRN